LRCLNEFCAQLNGIIAVVGPVPPVFVAAAPENNDSRHSQELSGKSVLEAC